MLPIIVGMNSGFTRFGPFSNSVRKLFCSSSMPPMPVPNSTETRVGSSASMSRPACAMASSEATMAYWTKRSKRRASFFVMPCSVGSNPRTSPAMCTSWSEVSKRSTVPMQHFLPMTASHSACTPTPAGVMAPMPVMTTRFVPSGLFTLMLTATYLRPRTRPVRSRILPPRSPGTRRAPPRPRARPGASRRCARRWPHAAFRRARRSCRSR